MNMTYDQEILESLANAIIKQAADDFRNAHRKLLKAPHDHEAKERIRDVKKFLRSRWYTVLTTIDGEYLLRMLSDEVREYTPKPEKPKNGKTPESKPRKTA